MHLWGLGRDSSFDRVRLVSSLGWDVPSSFTVERFARGKHAFSPGALFAIARFRYSNCTRKLGRSLKPSMHLGSILLRCESAGATRRKQRRSCSKLNGSRIARAPIKYRRDSFAFVFLSTIFRDTEHPRVPLHIHPLALSRTRTSHSIRTKFHELLPRSAHSNVSCIPTRKGHEGKLP